MAPRSGGCLTCLCRIAFSGRMGATIPDNGTELFYETIGEGDPIVVLGGTALGHSYLRPAMDRLADSFRVIYYDQRGSGNSPLGDAQRLSFDTAIADLAALLDGLGLATASLLGHSLGGDTVALFGSRHPDRVDALVVANPGPPFDPEGMGALESEMMSRRTPADNEALAEIRASAAFQDREPAALRLSFATSISRSSSTVPTPMLLPTTSLPIAQPPSSIRSRCCSRTSIMRRHGRACPT